MTPKELQEKMEKAIRNFTNKSSASRVCAELAQQFTTEAMAEKENKIHELESMFAKMESHATFHENGKYELEKKIQELYKYVKDYYLQWESSGNKRKGSYGIPESFGNPMIALGNVEFKMQELDLIPKQ